MLSCPCSARWSVVALSLSSSSPEPCEDGYGRPLTPRLSLLCTGSRGCPSILSVAPGTVVESPARMYTALCLHGQSHCGGPSSAGGVPIAWLWLESPRPASPRISLCRVLCSSRTHAARPLHSLMRAVMRAPPPTACTSSTFFSWDISLGPGCLSRR